ncbi:hypothetical protein B7494_g5591 [Chlorociboria aeruginascens]|nr:hypothetical protein B7494_g5591 [Chlorociboria aeruginascens]
MAAVPWQDRPYQTLHVPALASAAPIVPAPGNIPNQVPVNNQQALVTQLAPSLTPGRAAYTWIESKGIDWVLWPLPPAVRDLRTPVALRAVTRDLVSTYLLIAADLIAHDNPSQPGASIASQQLTNLIRSVVLSFVLPVIRSIRQRAQTLAEGAEADALTVQVQAIRNLLPDPPGAFFTPGWVTTKSHLELAMESLISRWGAGWADLRPRLFVPNDNQASGIPVGYYTVFNRQNIDATRSASPMVLSVTEIAGNRALVGTSQAKAFGYELLLRWAQAARMQRYDLGVAQGIRAAIDARNVAGRTAALNGFLDIQERGSVLARRVTANNAVILAGLPAPAGHAADVLALAQEVAAFQAAVVAYKTNPATSQFFYHPHAAVSFQANDLHRRTFCWSCWLLYRFDANEPANMVRWAEFPNYEPASVPPPGVNWRAYGNCAEAMIHHQCAGSGVHGMPTPAQNAGGHINLANGNWVPAPAAPLAVPAVWL